MLRVYRTSTKEFSSFRNISLPKTVYEKMLLELLKLRIYLVSGTVLACCAQLVASFPRSLGTHVVPDQQDDRYFFLNVNSQHCMPVRCLRLSDCSNQEYVVWFGGLEPCYGCPFCLDFPSLRSKRSLTTEQHIESRICEQVTCPEYLQPADASCENASIWYGYVRNRKCRSCTHCDVKISSKVHRPHHRRKNIDLTFETGH